MFLRSENGSAKVVLKIVIFKTDTRHKTQDFFLKTA